MVKQKSNLTVANTTKEKIPKKKIQEIYTYMLGNSYALSVVFIGSAFSKKLNTTYRNKAYPTNILTFPLDKDSGEIYITYPLAKKQAKEIDVPITEHLLFLLIHGILHLQGYKHGKKMEDMEDKIAKKFL